ncbi:MAG: tRNA pseudouridine(55) synthase TruB [Selenomonadaceae bacterium]|nr:tRNA pseudouridine(55) synthase TruB [Selenomonadaceae bacterium]
MSDGFINLNKPAGMTSHDAVNIVRKIFGTKKVGHAGTLDPAAVGILPIAVGRATKFIEYLADCNKTYRAEIIFGVATDTGDLEGEIIQRVEDFVLPSVEEIRAVVEKFTGEIEQVPPKHSAIKINGRKAYDLARRNVEFEMPRRRVTIHEIKILGVGENSVSLEINCGKGTYIRSLAVDIGSALKIPAALKFLQRTRVGEFCLCHAVEFDDLKFAGEKYLLAIEDCLSGLKKFELAENRVKAFCNGLATNVRAADETVRVYAAEKFLGVGKIRAGELRSEKLLGESLT